MLYVLSSSKKRPNLNFHCPICQSHSIALLPGWQAWVIIDQQASVCIYLSALMYIYMYMSFHLNTTQLMFVTTFELLICDKYTRYWSADIYLISSYNNNTIYTDSDPQNSHTKASKSSKLNPWYLQKEKSRVSAYISLLFGPI